MYNIILLFDTVPNYFLREQDREILFANWAALGVADGCEMFQLFVKFVCLVD